MTVLVVVGMVISVFTFLGVKGYYLVRQNQLQIAKIESKLEQNEIDLDFAKLSLGAASLQGKESFNKEMIRLEKLAKESDSLLHVRDSIYLNTPGTKINSRL